MRRLLILIATVAGTLLLAVAAGRPPAPSPADAPTDRFSAGRAMVDIRQIARSPHTTGSAEDARVRAYLTQRMQALGLAVETQATPLTQRGRAQLTLWGSPLAATASAVNLIGVLAGRDRSAPAVLLMAHHDTVAGSPGAADDSTGVAAILETVRALRAGPAPARDLIVLFTDGEELNSDGARAFFHDHPLAWRVGVVVNLEARGGGGRALMFETGPGNGPMVGLFARAVHGPSANSIAVLVYRLLPNFTDFSIPKAAGTAGFNFAFLGRSALYHAAQATPDAIDPGSVQHIGAQTLDIARALSQAPALPPHGPDAVFSDLFGLGVLAYPAWGGWVLFAATAALLGVAAIRVGKAGMLEPVGALQGAAVGLGAALVAGGLLQLANLVSEAGRGANYYDRLAAIPRLELQALATCLAVLCLAVGPRAGDARVWSGWLGLAGLVLVFSGLVQAIAPAAGPIMAWPLLLCAASAAFTEPRDITDCGRAAVRKGAVAAVAGVYLLGLAHFAFLGVGPDMPAAMAPFALLMIMMIWPLLRGVVPLPFAVWTATALMIVALGLALWVRLDAPAPTIPIYARTAAA